MAQKIRIKHRDGTYEEAEIPPGCSRRTHRQDFATAYTSNEIAYRVRKNPKATVWTIVGRAC